MKEVDKDNDGEINFREFKMMMTHLAWGFLTHRVNYAVYVIFCLL